MEFLFTDNVEVDSIEKVPQDFRGLYKEVDGKFKLGSDDPGVASAVAAVIRMTQALKAERAASKAAKEKAVDLSPLQEFGTSPEEIATSVKTKLEELQGQLAGGQAAKMNLEKIKEDLGKAHAMELKSRDVKFEALKGQLYNILVENTAKSAIAESKGDIELLMPFVSRNVKAVEENGEYKVYVVDGSGDVRYSGVTGQPMSINELVREMKTNERYARLFDSEAPSGGGFVPGQVRPLNKSTKTTLTSTEKIAQGLSKGGGKR